MPEALSLWIVVPTYNERENMIPLTESIRQEYPAVDTILIVDDGSPDGTAEEAARIPGVRVLARTGLRGYGHSMRDGLQLAYDEGADAVITMDADLSHDASILPRLVAGLAEADLLVGSRYCRGSALVENWPWHRLLISKMATTLVSVCTGAPVSDATSGYRCWSRELLGALFLEDIEAGGFAFLYESLYHANRSGARFAEIPNLYRGRIHGESKLNWKIAMEAMRLLPRLFLRRLTGDRGRRQRHLAKRKSGEIPAASQP
jgi:dolichol-phosphate mannosyltransferase